MQSSIRLPFVVLVAILACASPSFGWPAVRWVYESQNNMLWGTTNMGTFNPGTHDQFTEHVDALTGEHRRTHCYPKNSGNEFTNLGGYLWVGAVVGRDSLVSMANDWYNSPYGGEFWPDEPPFGEIRYETINSASPLYAQTAHSELDIICNYTDTVRRPELVHPKHTPMGVAVTQRAMVWSGGPIDDFVLVDFSIENIGSNHLRDIFVGIFSEFSMRHFDEGDWDGDTTGIHPYSGYLNKWNSPDGCGYTDTVNVAYAITRDGRPTNGQWDQRSNLAAVGKTILRTPIESPVINYNWLAQWQYQYWGPERKIPGIRNRDLEAEGLGYEDPISYYFMSRPEVDYDQIFAGLNYAADGWLPPPYGLSREAAKGQWGWDMLSFGRFDLAPGQTANFVYAWVGGDNVHVNPRDYELLVNPDNPSPFYYSLDFTELATNARWAQWVYDNPGFDTDGDGYRGEYRVCDGDTFWYKGDGVPDFRADVPPPAPLVNVIPYQGKLAIRWNGYNSESFTDPFTRQKDFEGYRVYLGLDRRESSLSLIAQFDYQNYNRYVMRQRANGTWDWQNKDMPFTLDSLRAWLNDPEFEPLTYPRPFPHKYQDTFYYFEAQSYNTGLDSRWVHKVYPDAVKPPDDTLQWTADMLTSEHGRPVPKYYEYEYILDSLLPTVEYYCAVTAFDFGFAFGGIPSREASKYANIINAYATPSARTVSSEGLDVYVWPNPYRYDGNYLDQGYENHDQSLWYDRARRVHFGNLPNKCTISILSLDGDLIKEIHHSFAPSDPEAQHDSFDLISRAGLLVVSGIYYWVVESEGRTQMGKFVVIE